MIHDCPETEHFAAATIIDKGDPELERHRSRQAR